MDVFITGGSGFLGSALLARLAMRRECDSIHLLLREDGKRTASQRLDHLLARIFPPAMLPTVRRKIHAVAGDLTKPKLGVDPFEYDKLAERISRIVHIGASTDFGAPLDLARQANVTGTERVLDLANSCRARGYLERLDYVSTAFVAGAKPGRISEDDFDRGQWFANNYERSKFEAEELVRKFAVGAPVSIIRPSIVVGDSRTGYTPHFKVLYWPLRLLALNIVPFIPCNSSARLDIVPIDFVSRSMEVIMMEPGACGRTFHVSAGAGNETSIGRLMRDAFAATNIKKRPIVPFWFYYFVKNSPLARFIRPESWEAMEMAVSYTDYLKGTGTVFENSFTAGFLGERGVTAPAWGSYHHNLFRYCLESRWGRRQPKPEYTYFRHFEGLCY